MSCIPLTLELAELSRQRRKTALNIRTLVMFCSPWSDTKEAVLNLGNQLSAIEARIEELRSRPNMD
jgi:hypothetical protein